MSVVVIWCSALIFVWMRFVFSSVFYRFFWRCRRSSMSCSIVFRRCVLIGAILFVFRVLFRVFVRRSGRFVLLIVGVWVML